jgi:predicted nucleic acid-binding protein
MTAFRLYLDTNIFISAFENNDSVAKKLLELFSLNEKARSHFLTTSEMTLAEVLVDPLRKGNERLVELYDNLTIGNALIHVGTVSREVLWSAAVLRAEHSALRLPDAIHLATAMLSGCSYFLTADSRLRDTYSVGSNILARLKTDARIAVIRPELMSLERLIREAAI